MILAMAIVHDNVLCRVPSELSDLAHVVGIFICRGFTVRPLLFFLRAGEASSPQFGFFGSMVALSHEGVNVLQQLPRSVVSEGEVLTVHFSFGVGTHLLFCKEPLRWRAKLAALLWLVAHNSHCTDIDIDDAALHALFEDGVPEVMVQSVVQSSASVSREVCPSRFWRVVLIACDRSFDAGNFWFV